MLAVTAAGFLVDDVDGVDSVIVEGTNQSPSFFFFTSHSLLQLFPFLLPYFLSLPRFFWSAIENKAPPSVPGLWFAGEIKNNKRQRSICTMRVRE